MVKKKKKLNIILLIAEATSYIGTIKDHIDAFKNKSEHNIFVFDSYSLSLVDFDFRDIDVIIFHYSLYIPSKGYIPDKLMQKIQTFKGPKILFIQDEYRDVDLIAHSVSKIGISVIFTVVNKDVVKSIYRHPEFENVRFEYTLTGYVPEHLLGVKTPDYNARTIDVSYRARKLPAWCGAFGQQKWIIGDRFKQDSVKYGLVCDIETSEESRMYGQAWIDFVANSKAVLGTESGSSIIDFSGIATKKINTYSKTHPDTPFETMSKMFLEGLVPGISKDGDITIHVISPRIFEAIALRTLLVLYPGDYSGILQPYRHYVPLAFDHSNMDEVVAILRDERQVTDITTRAYEEIACVPDWTFGNFMKHFDEVARQEAINAPNRNIIKQNYTVKYYKTLQLTTSKFAEIQVSKMQLAIKLVNYEKKLVNFFLNSFGPMTRFLPTFIRRPISVAFWSIFHFGKDMVKKILVPNN